MKVMISYPPLAGKGSPMLTQNRQFQWYHTPSYIYPLVPAMAATLLKQDGFEVIWNDCIAERRKHSQFLELVKKERPDIIAMETKTPVIKQHWQIIKDLKQLTTYGSPPGDGSYLKLTAVLMGDHVTALPEESMENSPVDFVITGGDYDRLLLNIARHLRNGEPLDKGIWYRDGGQVKTIGEFELNQDLNSLPFIDRELTKAHLYGEKWRRFLPFFYTMAGRDCLWGRCTFCSWCVLYPKCRLRSPQNLLDEIGMLIDKYGAREIFDDMGTFPAGRWLDEFCQGLINRGYNRKISFSCNMRFGMLKPHQIRLLKEANFRKLKMGLESASQKTLDRLDKGVKVEQIVTECKLIAREGLDIHLTIMIGYPWETKKDMTKTLELADSLMKNGFVEMLQSTVLVPYPGAELHKQGIENSWFRFDPKEYERYDMSEPVFKTADMNPQQVMAVCRQIYQTYFSPRYMLRHLLKSRSLADLGYLLRGTRAVAGHIRDFLR